MTDIRTLARPQKKIVAKILHHKGYTYREIGALLGFAHSTVFDAVQEPTPDELKEFETELADIFDQTEKRVAAKALRRIEDRLPHAQIGDALNVYKELRSKGEGKMMRVKGTDMTLEYLDFES